MADDRFRDSSASSSAAPGASAEDAADVIVAGAGVIGLAVAWELRRAGARVTLVDPEPASGASNAAAGMLAPAGEVQFQHDRLVPLMTASAAEYPEFIARLEAVAGSGSAGYRAAETLHCGADAADREALARRAALQEALGLGIERIAPRQARALEPALSPRLSAALRAPGDRQTDPRRLCRALLDALAADDDALPGPPVRLLRRRAVRLLRGLRAGAGAGTASERAPGGAPVAGPAALAEPDPVEGVELDDGTRLRAAETVLAAGADSGELEGLPGTLPLRPVHGDIVRTAALGPGERPLLERTVRALVHGEQVYLVPREDGSLVIGATTREDRQEKPLLGGVSRLLLNAQAVVPGVAELSIAEVSAGRRPGTPDDLPLIGRLGQARGLVVCTGHSRHGVLLAPLSARLAAALALEGLRPMPLSEADRAALAVTDPGRFGDHSEPGGHNA